MLLSDDRNLPMPLQKTQISTISFGHSVGTGRTGVRPAPDVPRGCPPQSFLRQEGPANPSAATFLSQPPRSYAPLVEEAGEAIIAKIQKAADLSNENCDRAMKLAHKLSMQLRAAEDRVNQLEAEVELLRDRAVRAERWLQTIQQEIEEKLIAPRSANATEQTSPPKDAEL